MEATIHPFVAYFVDSGELCHLSYIIISDCLHHDTTAVYLFQKCFITFLKNSCQKGCILRKQSISQMVRLPSTRTERTSSICASTRMILAYQQSGIFMLLPMEKELVIV